MAPVCLFLFFFYYVFFFFFFFFHMISREEEKDGKKKKKFYVNYYVFIMRTPKKKNPLLSLFINEKLTFVTREVTQSQQTCIKFHGLPAPTRDRCER